MRLKSVLYSYLERRTRHPLLDINVEEWVEVECHCGFSCTIHSPLCTACNSPQKLCTVTVTLECKLLKA